MIGIKKITSTLIGGGLILAGAAAPAFSAQNVGGGTWKYNMTDIVYSDYYHPSVNHGSTACNWSKCDKQQWNDAGTWSHAQVGRGITGNKVYWHVN
ncbi:MAG: lactococcin 972 family bacteriocin [Candidatus Ancillula sp.]|jgi:lactococcin 972 family bacteriocin|nr:lactococcin 972 family bacteriocin [Candidatus Ancillula sp.]